MQFVKKLRNKSIEAACQATKAFLNMSTLEGIGQVTELVIDPEAETAFGAIALEGETTPINFSIGTYKFSQDENTFSVRLIGFKTSKPWIDGLLKKMHPNGIYIRLNRVSYTLLSAVL